MLQFKEQAFSDTSKQLDEYIIKINDSIQKAEAVNDYLKEIADFENEQTTLESLISKLKEIEEATGQLNSVLEGSREKYIGCEKSLILNNPSQKPLKINTNNNYFLRRIRIDVPYGRLINWKRGD